MEAGVGERYGLVETLLPVCNTCGGISKASMIHNAATPHIEVDPETCEVRAGGHLLTRRPAEVLPTAQRYFLSWRRNPSPVWVRVTPHPPRLPRGAAPARMAPVGVPTADGPPRMRLPTPRASR